MPFRIKLRRSRRYNVLSKNYFVTQIRLLDANVIECTLSVESTGQECLEAVAQRLELRETHYFGLWFHSKTQVQRWVELEKPLKKQLDKFGSETLLFFAVMYYVPSVSRLEQEITRYQYYLQVKKDVLDGRLPCTVEQGIRLAGFAVQADFGDFTRYLYQDFLREYVLFPVNWPHVDEVLEEWTQKVAEEHKSHYQLQPAEAELLYIKEVEKLDGFGQESFAAKDNYTNDIFIGVSFIGVFVKHRNGRSIMLHRWKDIGTIGHNKSAITVEITRKDDTIMFHTEDIEMAKYIARLFTARHKFYKQNKICAEQDSSPETVRRRPTWNRLPRPQSCILPSQYDHYQDTQSSQDSIFHDDPYYKSESSLLELGFRNGPVPNGSVCSSPSASSLSRSQTFAHGSPVSSNPSLPSGELTRPDYAPSHRHSAIIAPSYRPTPEYDAVMRQKHRLLPATPSADLHSQSLRSLNISNAFAYRRPEALVYSQPEMRERGLYHAPYGGGGGGGPQPAYGPPAGPSSAPLGPGVPPMAGQASCAPGNGISHTVSTPELANTKQQQAGGAGQAGEVPHGPAAGGGTAGPRGRPSRPPPPHPAPFRPATSTPDLVSHRQRGVGGSSPETVTRKVQLSVKTFQPDSSSVVRQSLQEASELLTHAARRAVPGKGAAFALPRRNTQRDQAPPLAPPPARESPRPKSFRHQKTPSNVTMLVHSSESEEEEEEEYPPELDIHIPGLNEDIDARLQAALASIPNKPPPEYPGPRSGSADRALRHRDQDQGRPEAAQGRARAKATGGGPRAGHGAAGGPPPRAEQACLGGALLGPSISEPDLTSVKERVRKEPVKERPVSEMFSIEDSIVERECAQRTLERQMKLVDSMKRPLMMATLNGLYVTRMPAPENARVEGTKVSADEQWRHLELRLEEEALFTEYERVPKKAAERSVTTAALPENAERNRFRDVVPYEDTRVELVPSKDNNMGYINASHVRMMVRGEEWHYIATQGPLPNTCHDFWQMVWEQGVNVIAMVTAEEEGGRSKSHRYWPKLGSKHNSATHGKFKVTTKFRTDSGCYATTGLKVKHLLSGQERTVWHLQYTDWPEHGCPEYVQGFLSYLEEIQSVRRHTNSMLDTSKSLNPPVVVHCSAGVGRTGVVILTELMLSAMEHNEKVEVPVMLGWLRHQRMLMVQTMTQYKFVYQVLIQFLKSSRLI